MIKVKVNNEYKDVVKIFCGGTLQKEIVKVWSREAQEYVYESSVEYTGTLPITINANGDVLIDYRIYGADSGVGEPTENLFDNRTRGFYDNGNGKFIDSPLASYWRIPVTEGDIIYANNKDTMGWGCCFYKGNYVQGSRLRPNNFPYTVPAGVDEVTNNYLISGIASAMVTVNQDTPTSYVPYGYKLPMTVHSLNLIDASLSEQTIEIKPSTPYAVSRYDNSYNAPGLEFYIYDENDNRIWGDYLGTWHGENLRVFDNAKYFKITIPNSCLNAVSLVEGIRPPELTTKNPYPENYIPYQKITIPIYIGENQLGAGEYVSFSEQKIYRDVGGILAPTDPPVPLPEIPTIEGTTIIDYDGDPKPSQMYIKYRR